MRRQLCSFIFVALPLATAMAAQSSRAGASVDRTALDPKAERLKAATNSHSANHYRVNGVVSNMPEFQKAFSCKADAPMVRPNVCRVW